MIWCRESFDFYKTRVNIDNNLAVDNSVMKFYELQIDLNGTNF